MFARLLGEGDDQLLITLDEDERGAPRLKFTFSVQGEKNLRSLVQGFPNTKPMWKFAEDTLQSMSEDEARSMVSSIWMAATEPSVSAVKH